MRVRPSRVRRLRIRKAIGNVALAGAVLAIVGGYVAIHKTVTIVLEGRPQAVRTMSSSVGELLDAQGIDVGSGDLVTPSRATPLADGMTIHVELDFVRGGAPSAPADRVWVVERVRGPYAMLAVRGTEDWFSTFSAGGSVGQQAAVAANVVVMGKDHEVWTNATRVGELLSAMGIEPDRNDRVVPPPRTFLRPHIDVRYSSIDLRIREVEVPIPYTTLTQYTAQLDPGETAVGREGVDGVMLERYRVRVVDGEVVARSLLERRVLREAVAATRLLGREAQGHGSQVGEASWYSFAPGGGLTAAHPSLPFGTVVTVTNLGNGKSVQVVINDRGPFGGRVIDLSDEAFARIAPLSQGVCQVRLTW